MKIRFSQAPVKNFPDRKLLRTCLEETAQKHNFSIRLLQYVFVSDEELLEMNRDFLAHDYYTDIITFDLSEIEGEIEGEIYISRDRVRENADNAKVSVDDEFCRVIAHGLLHLCGLKDKSKEEQTLMRESEDAFLTLFMQKTVS